MNAAVLSIAGADDPALLQPSVPRDALHKAATVGAAMLLTAAFAFVAATSSALMVLNTHPWRVALAVGFGLLWAGAIFCIDRSLVLSMAKARWPAVAMRMLLAIVISISISAPIDIALFSDRVEAKLLENRQQAELESHERLNRLYGIGEAHAQSAAAQAELERLDREARIWPPQVLDAEQVVKACETDFARFSAGAQHEMSRIDRKRIDLQYRLNMLASVRPRPDGAIGELVRQRRILQTERQQHEAAIEKARKRCDVATASLQSERRRHLDEIQRQRRHATERLEQSHAHEGRLADTIRAKSEDATRIIDRALGGNFAAKAEALHQLVAQDPFVRTVYILILVLWITLEMAPVLAKMMAGATSVDIVLEAKARALELDAITELEQAESDAQRDRIIRDALRERMLEVMRADNELLRPFVIELLQAELVVAPQQELCRQLDELIERTQAHRDRITAAGLDNDSRRQLLAAVATLERSAADRIHQAFVGPTAMQPQS